MSKQSRKMHGSGPGQLTWFLGTNGRAALCIGNPSVVTEIDIEPYRPEVRGPTRQEVGQRQPAIGPSE
jgi:hypothetical protein